MEKDILSRYNKIKRLKLIAAIVIDLVGFASYLVPVIGPLSNLIWGPISGLLILLLFPTRKKMAVLGVAEEMIPFIDFVPTASLTWALDYVKDAKQTLATFVRKEVEEEQIVQDILNMHKQAANKYLD
jgi:hypothetical protein